MLFSSKKLAFQRQRQLFIDAYLKKDRPVWFALGSAWTGLDLSGQQYNIPAKDDYLLNDLIIPKVPFGLNTSMTGLSRNARWTTAKGVTVSFPTSSRNDAAFLFKQGVGRLIRREGVPQKHLWVLDSRIWLKNKKVYGVFQDILKPYSKGVV
jgi:CRISPR type IV-associated DEAD/DEAH-box helicase Csf4